MRRLWPRVAAGAGLAAALVLSWWWKVEDARKPDSIPELTLGQPVDLGRVRLTPLAVQRQGGELRLQAVVENVTGESQTAIFGIPPHPPQLRQSDGQASAPRVLLDRDGRDLLQLEPRMPETVTLIWPTEAPSGPVTIAFERQQFKLRDNLYGQASWLGFSPRGTLTVDPEVLP